MNQLTTTGKINLIPEEITGQHILKYLSLKDLETLFLVSKTFLLTMQNYMSFTLHNRVQELSSEEKRMIFIQLPLKTLLADSSSETTKNFYIRLVDALINDPDIRIEILELALNKAFKKENELMITQILNSTRELTCWGLGALFQEAIEKNNIDIARKIISAPKRFLYPFRLKKILETAFFLGKKDIVIDVIMTLLASNKEEMIFSLGSLFIQKIEDKTLFDEYLKFMLKT